MSNKAVILSFFALSFTLPPVSIATQEHEQHHHHDPARDRDRWMWQQPEKVIDSVGVKPGMVVADVGAGDGYFTFRLAQRVGSEGKVYAEDIDAQGLRRIKEIVARDDLNNVEIILGKKDDPLLPKKSLDMAFMVNVIHFIEKPREFFDNLRASFKPGATLVIVQWDSKKMSVEVEMSSSDLDLYSKEMLMETMKDAGYEILRIESFLPVQNIYVCRPH